MCQTSAWRDLRGDVSRRYTRSRVARKHCGGTKSAVPHQGDDRCAPHELHKKPCDDGKATQLPSRQSSPLHRSWIGSLCASHDTVCSDHTANQEAERAGDDDAKEWSLVTSPPRNIGPKKPIANHTAPHNAPVPRITSIEQSIGRSTAPRRRGPTRIRQAAQKFRESR
jgi:hypothetical protein